MASSIEKKHVLPVLAWLQHLAAFDEFEAVQARTK